MSVELAWVERGGGSFVVRRSATTDLGGSLRFATSEGDVILVVSGMGERRLSDADILLHVASSLERTPPLERMN